MATAWENRRKSVVRGGIGVSSGPTYHDADLLPAHARLLGQELVDIEPLPNLDLLLLHALEYRLQLAHHTLGALLHAPEDLGIGMGADKGEERGDADAAADENEPVTLKDCRGAVIRRRGSEDRRARLQQRRRDDGEWVILPGPQRAQRGEIRIRVAARRRRPAHALDVHPDDSAADLNDLGMADAHLCDAQDADEAVGEPHGARGVDPHLVAPLAVEEELDVVPGPDEHEDGKHDVHDEEPLVGRAARVQRADDEHDTHGKRGDDAPDPVLHYGLLGERALLDVQDELEDRVQYRL
ncbi:hypothetical protein V498_01690 [Pseudogymnoascus sp. VKM F-4517 (FW-2822)]|nr:hypothetical protein V498_01690 [Pseudogymnoascus sp. VKM F-4517 (FW-2822)]